LFGHHWRLLVRTITRINVVLVIVVVAAAAYLWWRQRNGAESC